MRKVLYIGFVLTSTAVALIGCAVTASNLLAKNQTSALQAATDRARFDNGCINPTATMVSGEVATPPVGQGNWVAGGRQAQYVIDVKGCGKSSTYHVNCTEAGTGCTAADINQPSAPN